MRRWLDREGTAAQRAANAESRRRRSEFNAFMLKHRARLADFYARSAPVEEKRAGKQRLFAELQDEYRALKTSWGGFAGYDRLFARGANNALLVSVASYAELVPAFRALLGKKQGDLGAFYKAARDLGRQEKPGRDARLAALTAE